MRAPGQLATEENGLRRIIEGEEAHLLAHPPAHHHVARQFRRRFQVVLRAGRDRSQPQLFGGASAERHCDPCLEIFLGQVMPVIGRDRLGYAQRHAARDDRDLVNRI